MTEQKLSTNCDLGIHSIDHFCLEVPDTSEGAKFFEEFGLHVSSAPGGAVELRTFGSPHLWGRLLPGDHRRIAYLSFGCFADDLSKLEARLRNDGVSFTPPHEEALAKDGIWFLDPSGLHIQVRVGEKKTPSGPIVTKPQVFEPGVRSVGIGQHSPRSRPTRLSHILVFVPDVLQSIAFYERTLGLRLSDKTEDVIAFTHAIHGSDHHLLAFAKSPQIGLHHTSWVMESLEDVGVATEHMRAVGHREGWGVGRHVLGSNYFSYIQDPWGSYAEYGFGIDHIPAGTTWTPASLSFDDPLNVWGPDMPAEFITNKI